MTTNVAGEILDLLHHIAPDVEPASVDPGRPLVDQLDLDSMDYQNLLAAIAARYTIEIPAEDVQRLGTLDELVAYIHARGAA